MENEKIIKRQKRKVIFLAFLVILSLILTWSQKSLQSLSLVFLLVYMFWTEAEKTENLIKENAHH